jgi:hypothetical protein
MIEIGLGERERLVDPQPGTPQDHDQPAKPAAVRTVTGGVHDGDDLLHFRRIGRWRRRLLRGERPAWKPGMSPVIGVGRRARAAART